GHADHGWLQARHSFSFASWYDPRHMGVSALRVINQDIVAPRRGFGQHPHDNMEILTYVLRGRLEHADTLGNRAEIRAGEFQLMSAGTGIRHSEMNPGDEAVELLQIWLFPNQQDAPPRYAQKAWPRLPGLQRVVAPEGESGDALPIRQDASIYRGILSAGDVTNHRPDAGRQLWIQVIAGSLQVENHLLRPGDGAEISDTACLQLEALADSEFLLFDLP
ncbi:MAG: pirin family protein, partial [Perlucidibaca sp.]